MIEVYFESKTIAEIVARFESEELYLKCFDILEKEAGDRKMFITEAEVEEQWEAVETFENPENAWFWLQDKHDGIEKSDWQECNWRIEHITKNNQYNYWSLQKKINPPVNEGYVDRHKVKELLASEGCGSSLLDMIDEL